jgi:hypothetical protein
MKTTTNNKENLYMFKVNVNGSITEFDRIEDARAFAEKESWINAATVTITDWQGRVTTVTM